MRTRTIAAALGLCALLGPPHTVRARQLGFTDFFQIERCTFATTGHNPYFILVPGHRLELEGKDRSGIVHLTITVLNETLTVGGVKTRVVEERETEDGQLV